MGSLLNNVINWVLKLSELEKTIDGINMMLFVKLSKNGYMYLTIEILMSSVRK